MCGPDRLSRIFQLQDGNVVIEGYVELKNHIRACSVIPNTHGLDGIGKK
jgi:hypothetical protein